MYPWAEWSIIFFQKSLPTIGLISELWRFPPRTFWRTVRDDVIRKMGIKRAIIRISKARSSWLVEANHSIPSFIMPLLSDWAVLTFSSRKICLQSPHLLPHLQHRHSTHTAHTSRHCVSDHNGSRKSFNLEIWVSSSSSVTPNLHGSI